VLRNHGQLEPDARLFSPITGISMVESTDLPGVQLYSGNFVDAPNGKRPYAPHSGICLEGQYFPNAMAIDAFQKPILKKGERYHHVIRYAFSAEL